MFYSGRTHRVKVLRMNDNNNEKTTRLKTANIFWDKSNTRLQSILAQCDQGGIEKLSKEDSQYLITELDRRLTQFWDKVSYENKLPNRHLLYADDASKPA